MDCSNKLPCPSAKAGFGEQGGAERHCGKKREDGEA